MRTRVRGPIQLLAIALALATLAGACGSDDGESSDQQATTSTTAPDAVRGGVLVVGTEGEVDSFLPATARWSSSALMVAKAVMDPLTAFDAEGNAQPYLAESLTPNESFTEWVITVREGVTFHNGQPLDGEALRVNLQQVMIESPLTSNVFKPVESVETLDERSVKVVLTTAWPHLPIVFANQTGFIVAPEQYDEGLTNQPIGTGPFEYVSWEPDNRFEAKRNTEYWQMAPDGEPLPYLDGVTFRPITDPSSRLAGLEGADLNLIQTQAASQIVDFANGDIPDGVNVLLDESEGTEANIIFNTETGPFSSVDLRRAAAHAVDRQAMVDGLFEGYFDVANAPFSPDSGWGTTDEFPGFDLEAAKAGVAAWSEANGGAEPSVTVTVLPSPENLLIGNYVKEQWDAVGIKTSIKTVEEAAGTAAMVGGDFEALVFSFWDRPDPDALYHYWDKDSTLINFSRYRSDTLNDALDRGRALPDRESRVPIYEEVWDEFADQVPMLWLYHTQWALAYRENVWGVGAFTLPDGQKGQPMTYGNTFLTSVFISG